MGGCPPPKEPNRSVFWRGFKKCPKLFLAYFFLQIDKIFWHKAPEKKLGGSWTPLSLGGIRPPVSDQPPSEQKQRSMPLSCQRHGGERYCVKLHREGAKISPKHKPQTGAMSAQSGENVQAGKRKRPGFLGLGAGPWCQQMRKNFPSKRLTDLCFEMFCNISKLSAGEDFPWRRKCSPPELIFILHKSTCSMYILTFLSFHKKT